MTIEVDSMMQQGYQCFRLQNPAERDVTSLRNWLHGTRCIDREETAFLDKGADLANLASPHDEAIASLEPLIQWCVIQMCRLLKKVSNTNCAEA